MFDRVGPVAGVHRIEDEHRILAAEAPAGRLVEAADRQLHLALEGVVAGEQPEQQHRQGKEVAVSPGPGLPQQHLRGHEPRGAQHGARLGPVHRDVVVVADQDATAGGLQEEVAQGDVLVAEARQVEGVESVGQAEAGPQHLAQADRQPAGGMLAGPHVGGGPQGHQIAEALLADADQGPAGGAGPQQGDRPEEGVVRRRGPDAGRQAPLQAGVAGDAGRQVPLQGQPLPLQLHLVHLALGAAPEAADDPQRCGQPLEAEAGALRQDPVHGRLPAGAAAAIARRMPLRWARAVARLSKRCR